MGSIVAKKFKNHWLVFIVMILSSCLTAGWLVTKLFIVEPRDFKIRNLSEDVLKVKEEKLELKEIIINLKSIIEKQKDENLYLHLLREEKMKYLKLTLGKIDLEEENNNIISKNKELKYRLKELEIAKEQITTSTNKELKLKNIIKEKTKKYNVLLTSFRNIELKLTKEKNKFKAEKLELQKNITFLSKNSKNSKKSRNEKISITQFHLNIDKKYLYPPISNKKEIRRASVMHYVKELKLRKYNRKFQEHTIIFYKKRLKKLIENERYHEVFNATTILSILDSDVVRPHASDLVSIYENIRNKKQWKNTYATFKLIRSH